MSTPLATPTAPPRRRLAPSLQLALGIFAVATAALGHVYLHLQVLQSGYEISSETHRRHELEEQNQKLRPEHATRRDPSVIERRARDELKMAPPDPSAIRTLRLAPGALAEAAPKRTP